MAKPHKIERIYAWIATDDSGEDGIPGIRTETGVMPLIGSDKNRIESMRSAAMSAVANGFPVRLVEFTGMVVLETIPGRGKVPKHLQP